MESLKRLYLGNYFVGKLKLCNFSFNFLCFYNNRHHSKTLPKACDCLYKHYFIIISRMYTQKKNYILQLKVSRFHDHQAILQSKDQSYLLYCAISGT